MPVEDRGATVRETADRGFRLALAGDDAGAVEVYSAALKRKLGRQVPVFMHLDVLRRSGRGEIAGRIERLSLRYGADITFASLQPQSDPAAALAEYRGLFGQGLFNGRMIANYAAFLSRAGETDELAQLMDQPRLLKVVRLDAKLGQDLGAAVTQVLQSDAVKKTWTQEDQTIREMHRVMDVDRLAAPCIDLLFRSIRQEVADHLGEMDRIAHPVFRWRPADFDIGAWALMSSGPGHNLPHRHPQGWLTGVYYAAWRPAAGAQDRPNHGALHVGPPGPRHVSAGWPRAAIPPDAGTLALMPSYYTHHTLPTAPGSLRVCVPFDVTDRRFF
jgi:hypothetical protein